MAYVRKKEGSKQEIAYQKIKSAILNNELAPDTMLIENDLCDMVGFSKTPIREALRRLMSEGFVEFIPEKGTFVSKLSIDEFLQMFDVREVLEGLAARQCAIQQEDTVVEKLEDIISKLHLDLKEGKSFDSVQSDMDFHEVIINGSQNKMLMNFTKTMIQQIHRFASTTMDDYARLNTSYQEHMAIYEAICNREADAAERAMREHIISVKQYQISRHYQKNTVGTKN